MIPELGVEKNGIKDEFGRRCVENIKLSGLDWPAVCLFKDLFNVNLTGMIHATLLQEREMSCV